MQFFKSLIYCLFGLPSGDFEMYAKEQGFTIKFNLWDVYLHAICFMDSYRLPNFINESIRLIH